MKLKNYGYYQYFTENMYNRFNGDINTIVPSINLLTTINNFKSKVILQAVGFNYMLTTAINLPHIYKNMQYLNGSDEDCRATILFTILHELSHCDQEIDDIRLHHEKIYRNITEYTNDLNVIKFINNNIKEIAFYTSRENSYKTWEDIFPYYALENWHNEYDLFKEIDLKYNQSTSIRYTILSSLSSLVNEYIFNFYNIRIIFNFMNSTGKKLMKVLNVINEGNFVLNKKDTKYLADMMLLNLKELESPVKANKTMNMTDCDIYLNVKSLDAYNVVNML